jgi:hypothetical protein
MVLPAKPHSQGHFRFVYCFFEANTDATLQLSQTELYPIEPCQFSSI